MIFNLLACIYITAICWGWGIMLSILFKKISGDAVPVKPDFIITCFSGLALVTVVTGFVSLFTPLGGIVNQLWILLPLLLLLFYRNEVIGAYGEQAAPLFKGVHPVIWLSLSISLLLALVMSASEIIHPDTLHYHAQCIQWIEQFRVIPGLVNLGYHFGLQSSWFTASAIFSLKFTGSHAPTFLNTAVIAWFIIFLHQRINENVNNAAKEPANIFYAALWLLLFIFSFWSFTQVRVTLSSSSPDFIVTLYIWLVFYLFSRYREGEGSRCNLLILFLAFFCTTIKLSGAPIALFAVFIFAICARKNKANVLAFLLVALLTVTPFITRNIITTGYPLFPSAALNIFQADWKTPPEVMKRQSAFIKAYARAGDNTTIFGDERINNMSMREWLPLWWEKRSLSNKLIIAGLIILMITHLLLFKRTRWKENKPLLYSIIFSMVGMLLWFKEAPDPRFGFGYIIPAEAILLYLLIGQRPVALFIKRRLLLAAILCFAFVLAGYGIYRLMYYFKPQNIINPEGITATSYQTVNCNGIVFNRTPNDQCGSNPLPCIYYDCGQFLLRGTTINDGFKPGANVK